MTGVDILDELLPLALVDTRRLEPTAAQVAAVVAAARRSQRRSGSIRRAAGVGAATFTVAAATAFAVPQTREAILDAAGSFADFFTDHGDPPGRPVTPTDRPGRLNWFAGTDGVTGTVIAESGGVRGVAYRRQPGDLACLEWGLAVSECRTDTEWSVLLADETVHISGTLPTAAATDLVPVVGVAADNVASVRLEYAGGGSTDPVAVTHGFIVFADPSRRPRRLIAADASGAILAATDVTGFQWQFVKPGRP